MSIANSDSDNYQRSSSVYKKSSSFYGIICTVCLGSFCVGFTQIYYYTMAKWNFQFCKPQQWQKYFLIGAIVPITAVLGSFVVAGFLQKYLSRRQLLITSATIGIIGSILYILSFIIPPNSEQYPYNLPLFIIGRVLHGIMVGIYLTFCLVIINQYSPYQRKLIGICIFQIAIELGILLPNIIYPLTKILLKYQWNSINIIMYSSSIVVFIIQIILLWLVYKQQSPMYLLQNHRQEEAKSVLSSIYQKQYVYQKFLQVKLETEIQDKSYYQNFDKKSICVKGVFLGIYAVFVQQMSGINFVTIVHIFTPKQPSYLQILISVLPVTFQFIGTSLLLIINLNQKLRMFFFRSNRKPFINLGCIFSACVMLIAIFLQSFQISDKIKSYYRYYWLILESLYMLVHGFTLSAVIWVYLSQMLKSKQLYIVLTFYWVFVQISMFIFTMVNYSYKDFPQIIPIIFCSCCLVVTILNKWYMIETKNQSSLEIIREIDKVKLFMCKKSQ